VDFAKSVIDATCEIFETMLMTRVTPGDPLPNRSDVFVGGISGMVGMAGGYRGLLAIHCSDQVAMAITGTFLGIEVDTVDDDVKDAIGEMANMLAGSVKSSLSENGKDIKLSIPSAVGGEEYTFECHAAADQVLMPFKMPDGEFLVELQLQEQSE